MSEAVISDCGTYRYVLTRGARPLADALPFVMLNPSTADAMLDDPTIRRCKGFAESLGYNGIVVMNLYALRATQPSALWEHTDPVGPQNDTWLGGLNLYPMVVCAWGANAKADRVKDVVEILTFSGTKLKCLGTTKAGAPKHPLYIKGSQELIDWELK